MSKGYGLILPGKGASSTQPKADFARPSIFGSDSDSEDNGPPVKTGQNRSGTMGPGNAVKRQARIIQEKALEEDPTVFQYDELYDDMESKRDEEKKAKSSEVKKPRYINKLLECAERRKIEYERRIERLAQKEREAEGDEFKDKESFVTSSYKKKLEELQKAEEREQREEYLEAIGDVTKQQDLGGFYRHLYEQKLGSDKTEKSKEVAPDETPSPTPKAVQRREKINPAKSRAYRKRRTTEDEEDEEENATEKTEGSAKKAHLQSNLDADSDFSIDSSSDSEEEKETDKGKFKEPQPKEPQIKIKEEPVEEAPKDNPNPEKEKGDNVETAEIKTEIIKTDSADKDKKEVKEKKPKTDIWKKRTVGAVFDAAFQRYCQRKAARQL